MNANFTQAKLTAAHLEKADLRYARFQQTRLQAAHLEGADLRAAAFQQANLGTPTSPTKVSEVPHN